MSSERNESRMQEQTAGDLIGWKNSPDDEPEYVGVFDDPVDETCQHWVERDGEHKRCGEEATHTVVMRTSETVEIASCDDHGTPDHAGKSLYERA